MSIRFLVFLALTVPHFLPSPARAGFLEKVFGANLGQIDYSITVGQEPHDTFRSVYSLRADITNRSEKMLQEAWFECAVLQPNGEIAIQKGFFVFRNAHILPNTRRTVYLHRNTGGAWGAGVGFVPLSGYKVNCRLDDARFENVDPLYQR